MSSDTILGSLVSLLFAILGWLIKGTADKASEALNKANSNADRLKRVEVSIDKIEEVRIAMGKMETEMKNLGKMERDIHNMETTMKRVESYLLRQSAKRGPKNDYIERED